MVQAGQYVTDGTAVFLVTDIRDGSQVGDIKLSPILRKGYVKANGALLTSASTNYPRLVQFITDNPSLKATDDTAWNSNKALYVYDDTNDTLRVPDATGRVLQGGNSVEEKEAGLPNIAASSLQSIPTTDGSMSPTINNFTSGAFAKYSTGTTNRFVINGNVPSADYGLDFKASRSSPIYGSSTTVQPPALTMIPQIKY
jgi:hypothetical protein